MSPSLWERELAAIYKKCLSVNTEQHGSLEEAPFQFSHQHLTTYITAGKKSDFKQKTERRM